MISKKIIPMKTHLRKVGNSRGLIIPAALLEACQLGEEVELRVEGKTLVIEAMKAPRASWFDGYQSEDEVEAWEMLPADEGDEEWTW